MRGLKGCVALALVGAVAGCGADVGPDPGGEKGIPAAVTIGFLDSMTGGAGFCGQKELQGAKVAVEVATRQRLLGDARISLDVVDDQGAPETAVAGLQKLLRSKASAIVGPCSAPMGTATVPHAQKRKIPQILTTAGGVDISGSYAFRAGISQQRYTAAAVRTVAAAGAKRVAVIWDKAQPTVADPVWRDVQKPEIRKQGLTLTDDEAVTTTQTDFSNQINSLLVGKPDAIGVLLVGAANLTVVKQLREAGFKGTIWGQEGMINDAYVKAGPVVEGTLIPASYAPNFTGSSSVEFTRAFRAAYGTLPTELAAHGYDAAMMALKAIRSADSVNRGAVQEALAAMKTMDGAQGALTFDADGDVHGKGGVVEIKGGELVGYEAK